MLYLVLACFAVTVVPMYSFKTGGFKNEPGLSNGNNTFVQTAVDAINRYYTNQGDNTTRTLVKVVQAQSQVVEGTNYIFTLLVTQGTKSETCKVTVWSRPWLSENESLLVTRDPVCKYVYPVQG